MTRDKDRKERIKAEEAFFKAGYGTWFHNETNQQVFVDVQLYPKVKRWLVNCYERVEISKQELENNYHRLRL